MQYLQSIQSLQSTNNSFCKLLNLKQYMNQYYTSIEMFTLPPSPFSTISKRVLRVSYYFRYSQHEKSK